MTERSSGIWNHYQKLQEILSELLDPNFVNSSRSLLFIILNQAFTEAEKLFAQVEPESELSRHKQNLLIKLSNHIENSKDHGISLDFREFLALEMLPLLGFIKGENISHFNLAS